jgi:hypothetical protein
VVARGTGLTPVRFYSGGSTQKVSGPVGSSTGNEIRIITINQLTRSDISLWQATERKLLIRKRGAAKAALTRIETFVSSFTEEQDLYLIRSRFENLPNICEEYKEIQDQLEFTDEEEDHSADREQFETKFYEVKSKINWVVGIPSF